MEFVPETIAGAAGIELVDWPEDEALRDSLARAGVPRLLVLGPGAPPPAHVSFDEDWIRRPFDEADLTARLHRIRESVAAQRSLDAWLDEQHVLHRGRRTTVLTRSEALVAQALLERLGSTVSRDTLEALLWPDGGPPSARAIDAIVYRLRRRCLELGITIRNARGEGFVLLTAAA